MPHFDLRQDDGTLDPLASFKVLAVMCHPNNRIQQGKRCWQTSKKKPGREHLAVDPLTSEEFIAEVRRTDKEGPSPEVFCWR